MHPRLSFLQPGIFIQKLFGSRSAKRERWFNALSTQKKYQMWSCDHTEICQTWRKYWKNGLNYTAKQNIIKSDSKWKRIVFMQWKVRLLASLRLVLFAIRGTEAIVKICHPKKITEVNYVHRGEKKNGEEKPWSDRSGVVRICLRSVSYWDSVRFTVLPPALNCGAITNT